MNVNPHHHEIVNYITIEDPNKFTKYPIYRIDPTTLSQFTGWKDSHNHRIFENDIVEIVSSAKHSYKYLIWWCREMNMLVAIDLRHISFNGTDYYSNKAYRDYDTFCFMMQDPYGDAQDIKVVGNIFDNPELLEENLDER